MTSETLELELEQRSNRKEGITKRKANIRLVAAGLNELPETLPPSSLKILLAQFSSLIGWVLVGAAIHSIVVLNAILGVWPGIPSRAIAGSHDTNLSRGSAIMAF